MTTDASSPTPRRKRVLITQDAPLGAAQDPSPQDAAPAPGEPSPQDAPPPPDATPIAAAPSLPGVRVGPWLRVFASLLGVVLSIAAALLVDDLYRSAAAASPLLGWIVAGLLIALAAAGALIVGRELAALGRLRRIGALRMQAEAALADGARPAKARAVIREIEALYRGRRDLAWSQARYWRALADRAQDQADPAARLALYEREVVGRLDAMAQAEIEKAARRVAAATALMPSALLDAIAALAVNLIMIRRLAEIYGGRASLWGSVGLARRVVAHAMAAGLIELGTDFLTPLIGGGLAAGASRRLGEGLVNGAMTVRIGLAAAELCRPMPYVAAPRPSAQAVAWGALKGLARREASETAR